MAYSFSERDRQQIETHGLTLEQVAEQLELFKKGTFYYSLSRPCTMGDGIAAVAEEEKPDLIAGFERERLKGRMIKLVPASGAASRMFRDWHLALEEGFTADVDKKIIEDIDRYAFSPDLDEVAARRGESLSALLAGGDLGTILDLILNPGGLNYSNLPKALLKFHRYPDRSRTSLEEHLVEAVHYARNGRGIAPVHFTVSEEHKTLIEDFIHTVRTEYEREYRVRFDIGISTQMNSTDTIAVDRDDRIFRDASGLPVFRPGGHGALLENLAALKGDIVLIKNIDNVVPDYLKAETVSYKKILGGLLLKVQSRIFAYLERLERGEADPALIAEIVRFCAEIGVALPPEFEAVNPPAQIRILFEKLNRPIRVCGVVRNEGEPGGGPFWIDEDDGTQSLQIIESAQVDFRSEAQRKIWESATHFNPVDLACGVRDFRGDPFDLGRFIDRRACFISEKSQNGRALKALEWPGLWNGGMAFWITLFLEVPIETFNPVKTVEDLLRPQHQPVGGLKAGEA